MVDLRGTTTLDSLGRCHRADVRAVIGEGGGQRVASPIAERLAAAVSGAQRAAAAALSITCDELMS